MISFSFKELIAIVAMLSSIATTSCYRGNSDFRIISKEIESVVSMDSTSISITDTLTLDIGDYMNPIPYHDVMVTYNGIDLYIAEDDGKVYTFDIFNNKLIKTQNIKNYRKLTGLSGIAYANDFLWIYDYKNNRINAFGDNMDSCLEYPLPNNNEGVNAWVMSDMPLIITQKYIYISGTPFQNPYNHDSNYPTTLIYNRETKQVQYAGLRGEPYNDKKFFCGYDHMWRIYQSQGSDSCILLSTPLNPKVLRFDADFNYIGNYNIGSRYTGTTLYSAKYTDNFNENEDRSYYSNNHTYRAILYDSKDSVYYRIATHPITKIYDERYGLKPFSVIVAANDGKILSETSIINNPNKFYYDKVFMTSKGLLMQISSTDETKMNFILISYKKSKSNENK